MEQIQKLMDAAYARWHAHPEWSQEVFQDQLSAAERFAVRVGNYHYQVLNGGHTQWVENNYGTPETMDYLLRQLPLVGTPAALEAHACLTDFAALGFMPIGDEEFNDWQISTGPIDLRYYGIDEDALFAGYAAYIAQLQ